MQKKYYLETNGGNSLLVTAVDSDLAVETTVANREEAEAMDISNIIDMSEAVMVMEYPNRVVRMSDVFEDAERWDDTLVELEDDMFIEM